MQGVDTINNVYKANSILVEDIIVSKCGIDSPKL